MRGEGPTQRHIVTGHCSKERTWHSVLGNLGLLVVVRDYASNGPLPTVLTPHLLSNFEAWRLLQSVRVPVVCVSCAYHCVSPVHAPSRVQARSENENSTSSDILRSYLQSSTLKIVGLFCHVSVKINLLLGFELCFELCKMSLQVRYDFMNNTVS